MTSSEPGPTAEGNVAEPAQTSPLDLLLEVQEQDLALDRLAYRRRELPERAAVADLEAQVAEDQARVTETRAQRDKLAGQQDELDRHASAVGERIATIEQRLQSGRAGSYRDEQAMGEEAGSLARQRREIEDQELEVMEALEPLEAELATCTAELAATSGELGLAREQLAEAEAELDAGAAAVRSVRGRLAEALPADLAASYERLRSKLGGVGAARLVHGACDGCHLQLPASELDRLRHAAAGAVVYCDQCGRILVP